MEQVKELLSLSLVDPSKFDVKPIKHEGIEAQFLPNKTTALKKFSAFPDCHQFPLALWATVRIGSDKISVCPATAIMLNNRDYLYKVKWRDGKNRHVEGLILGVKAKIGAATILDLDDFIKGSIFFPDVAFESIKFDSDELKRARALKEYPNNGVYSELVSQYIDACAVLLLRVKEGRTRPTATAPKEISAKKRRQQEEAEYNKMAEEEFAKFDAQMTVNNNKRLLDAVDAVYNEIEVPRVTSEDQDELLRKLEEDFQATLAIHAHSLEEDFTVASTTKVQPSHE